MSLSKILLLAGVAAFVSSAALAGGHKNIPFRASGVTGSHEATAQSPKQPAPSAIGPAKCGTGFGTATDPADGIIAWNDTSGSSYDTGGAADFTCAEKTKVKQVWVRGYFGATSELFNVTFYQNDAAGGSDEANDGKVVCAYTGLLGTAGGAYPTDVTTKLKLPTACKFKPGKKYWVAVQNNDADGPWYWMVQATAGAGSSNADWADRHQAFTADCVAFDNGLYLDSCLGFDYPDWQLELH